MMNPDVALIVSLQESATELAVLRTKYQGKLILHLEPTKDGLIFEATNVAGKGKTWQWDYMALIDAYINPIPGMMQRICTELAP